jgi:hypothetical protein
MIWHLLAWAGVLFLWGLWSALCWLGHAVLVWDGWKRGADWTAHVPEIPVPDWLADLLGLSWVQALREALIDWGPELQAWLQSLPDLGAMATGAVWALWAVGTVLLVLAGLAVSGLIALIRRSSPRLAPAGG